MKTLLSRAILIISAGLVLLVIVELTVYGQRNAAEVSGIVAVPLAALGLWLQATGDRGWPVAKAAEGIREDIKVLWGSEVRHRGLDGAHVIPMSLSHRRGDALPAEAVMAHNEQQFSWTSEEYQEAAARIITNFGKRRAVIYAGQGGGKTTFALLLALGVVKKDTNWLPILLSLASWNPGAEQFDSWFDRQVVASYRSVEVVERPLGRTYLQTLVHSGRALLILDGLDELPQGTRRKAFEEINEKVPHDAPIVILGRGPARGSDYLANGESFDLIPPGQSGIVRYLRVLVAEDRIHDRQDEIWAPLLEELSANPKGRLSRVLSTPLFVSLAWRVYEEDENSPIHLLRKVQSADNDERGLAVGENLLLDAHIRYACARDRLLSRKRAVHWLEFMAYKMQNFALDKQKRGIQTFAWWRIYQVIPQPVIAGAMGLAVAPAYRLALVMPEGLTRGFAIGSTTGIIIGMMRGIRPTLLSVAITGAVASAMVALIGVTTTDWHTAVADVAEIGTALTLVMLAKPWLTGTPSAGKRIFDDRLSRWALPTAAVVAIGILSALATTAVHVILPAVPVGHGPLSLTLAVSLGVGVATVAGRLLTHPDMPLHPSHVEFRLDRRLGRPWLHVAQAIVSGTAVGLAGGFVGGVTRGVSYGLHIALVFGLVAGLPVGLAGGMLKWFNQPSSGRVTAGARKTFENDRVMALACVVIVAVASTVSIAVLLGPFGPVIADLHDHGFRARPVDGFLFGLTLGAIVAGFNAAWPTFFVAHIWFVLNRGLPWRFMTFLNALHQNEILRQEGPLYQFRNDRLQTRLAERYGSARRR